MISASHRTPGYTQGCVSGYPRIYILAHAPHVSEATSISRKERCFMFASGFPSLPTSQLSGGEAVRWNCLFANQFISYVTKPAGYPSPRIRRARISASAMATTNGHHRERLWIGGANIPARNSVAAMSGTPRRVTNENAVRRGSGPSGRTAFQCLVNRAWAKKSAAPIGNCAMRPTPPVSICSLVFIYYSERLDRTTPSISHPIRCYARLPGQTPNGPKRV
jgi:hypothetical protein